MRSNRHIRCGYGKTDLGLGLGRAGKRARGCHVMGLRTLRKFWASRLVVVTQADEMASLVERRVK